MKFPTWAGDPSRASTRDDRNLLGFRRDLLTAAAYGVDHFLFVYGDLPGEGRRTEDLTVRAMISEVKSFGAGSLFEGYPDFRIGAVVKPGRPLAWRTSANFVLVQISYGMRRLFEWRSQLSFDGRMFAGVLVLASASMARRVNAKLPDIRIPERVIEKLENDPRYGLQVALEQMDTIKESGLFDGVHLVPVGRYAEMAELLRARH